MLRDSTGGNVSWKKKVLEVFDYYTDRTPGSFIENKEVCIAWHYGLFVSLIIGKADVSFGSWQAAEMQNHLLNVVISSYPIHTLATKKRIEVMPRNVSKATIIRKVLQYHQSGRLRRKSLGLNQHQRQPTKEIEFPSSMSSNVHNQNSSLFSAELDLQFNESFSISNSYGGMSDSSTDANHKKDFFDFILCIGDDRTDEVMFEYLNRLEPSNAHPALDYETMQTFESDIFYDNCILEDSGGPVTPERRLSSKRRPNRCIYTCTVGSKSRYFSC